MFRTVHVGKIYRVSKNESGYLLWIPKKVAREVGLRCGDHVVLMSDGSRILVVPADRVGEEVGEVCEVAGA